MKRSVSDDDRSKHRKKAAQSEVAQGPSKKPKKKESESSGSSGKESSGNPETRGFSSSTRTGDAYASPASTGSSNSKPSSGETGAAFKGTNVDRSNFAERLMHVLENEIAPDCLWWLGDGEAVAVNPDKIKNNAVMNSHFQGNRYSSFVRNLNRWGFRRISFYSLPESCVAFHNSLFQKNQPYLLKQMKVDSDFKDVSGTQHLSEKQQSTGEPERPSGAASAPAGWNLNPTAASGEVGQYGAMSSSIPLQQSQQQSDQQEEPGLSMQESVLALLKERLNQPQQGTAAGTASVNPAASMPSTIQQGQQYHQRQGQQQATSSQSESGHVDSCMRLLQRLLQLAQRYLSEQTPGGAEVATIRTLLQLLLLLGQQELQHQQEQLQQGNALSAVQQLVSQLGQLAGNQQTPGLNTSHLQQLLLQGQQQTQFRQEQQQQQQPQFPQEQRQQQRPQYQQGPQQQPQYHQGPQQQQQAPQYQQGSQQGNAGAESDVPSFALLQQLMFQAGNTSQQQHIDPETRQNQQLPALPQQQAPPPPPQQQPEMPLAQFLELLQQQQQQQQQDGKLN